MYYCYTDSPVGRLLLAGDDRGLALIGFPNGRGRREPDAGWTERPGEFADAVRQLDEYFAGDRQVFSLALNPSGTEFQRAVLDALLDIPYGETRSYADIAQRIGRPKAVRAVGAANGRNPLPIVIPCHRVIGKDGSLTGFGGGLPTKVKLLQLEAGRAEASLA